MGSKIGFEIRFIVVEAIRGRCASFMVLTATVSEISGILNITQTSPEYCNINGQQITDTKVIANEFNTFFFSQISLQI